MYMGLEMGTHDVVDKREIFQRNPRDILLINGRRTPLSQYGIKRARSARTRTEAQLQNHCCNRPLVDARSRHRRV